MEGNFDVKYKDHFKLYVQIKDKVTFESHLALHEISYYSDTNDQAGPHVDVRYFLQDEDRPLIDEIIKSNGIIASTETIPLQYIHETQKLMWFSLVIIVALVLITVVAIVVFG